MTLIRLRYVQRFRDRHGKVRHYLRVPGQARVPLPGQPGTPEFQAAYNAALAAAPPRPPIGAAKVLPGSLDALAVAYFDSHDFKALSATTQGIYRRIIEKLRAKHGEKPIKLMEPHHVRKIVAEIKAPSAANHRLKVLRILLRFALDLGWIKSDPSRDARRVKYKVKGYPAWTQEMVDAYRARWPSGTMQRLALELLFHTGQRKSDVVLMGPQHLHNGVLRLTQVKTGQDLAMPLHLEAAIEIALLPPGERTTFLQTAYGQPISAKGFYAWFRKACVAAGIPKGYSAHGIRKTMAARAADAGGTVKEIAAFTGHRTLGEIQRYTESADRAKMAGTMAAKMQAAAGTGIVKPARRRVSNRRPTA
ncbi:tyrosine-type recombinase/integrase [Roseomonas xinghualingensis]|uniref:tyrosine-type recombinase/integrase n=1 Tax=Roseomonas xinghualingensis TaxID=2986475 RepID=UPI0021F16543|nr:tyrosine-type recombinase/integrase [Roseomonas sp. SXEYE001]MCV4208595.1 tyrosine-type recombinase/integrase [Roseomonas sp. SXEYE001]